MYYVCLKPLSVQSILQIKFFNCRYITKRCDLGLCFILIPELVKAVVGAGGPPGPLAVYNVVGLVSGTEHALMLLPTAVDLNLVFGIISFVLESIQILSLVAGYVKMEGL